MVDGHKQTNDDEDVAEKPPVPTGFDRRDWFAWIDT
jgi:hypothetical protein